MKKKTAKDYELKDGIALGYKQFGLEETDVSIPNRSCLATISTTTVDEEGESVLPEGIALDRFRKTMCVFYNHDYSDAVGTCSYIRRTEKGLEALTIFPERPEGHEGEWRPDTILGLIACDPPIIRGTSIGFGYIETRAPTQKDIETFPNTGNKLERVVSKSRLLEYSLVGLPMNEDCLITAVQKGILTSDYRLHQDLRDLPPLNLKVSRRLPIMSPSIPLRATKTLEEMVEDELDIIKGRVYS
jgi:phage head maturation protease